MGNSSSRRHHHRPTAPQINASQYAFAAPPQYPNPNLPYSHYHHQYPPGFYSPHPAHLVPFPQNFHRYPCSDQPPVLQPVEHQKAVTIRNDVNIKKDTFSLEEDEQNPGSFVVSFTFDATAAGSITVAFFAKEDGECNMKATKEDLLQPVTVSFEQGLGQKFRQPNGSGIDFSKFQESELKGEADGVYPLMVKADSHGEVQNSSTTGNSQITLAVFDKKEDDRYIVKVMKQILWVNGTRYELQEIYGIGNSVEVESDENDTGKECVICLSEPRDTTVLPCRHMCMCSSCAKVLRCQTNRCPICRQLIERLLEIKVKDGGDD